MKLKQVNSISHWSCDGEFEGNLIYIEGNVPFTVSQEAPTCREFVQNLPEFQNEGEDECSACLSKGKENELWTEFSCGHKIHVRVTHTAQHWLNKAHSCPTYLFELPKIKETAGGGSVDRVTRDTIEALLTFESF